MTEARIQRALEVLLAGRTAFVVAHRLSTIRNADQVLVLDHGRIVERGTHDELARRRRRLRRPLPPLYRVRGRLAGPPAMGRSLLHAVRRER